MSISLFPPPPPPQQKEGREREVEGKLEEVGRRESKVGERLHVKDQDLQREREEKE